MQFGKWHLKEVGFAVEEEERVGKYSRISRIRKQATNARTHINEFGEKKKRRKCVYQYLLTLLGGHEPFYCT